ncbi:hypothetical protein AB0F11_35545, partial [Streptomyces sp. NPDC032472]
MRHGLRRRGASTTLVLLSLLLAAGCDAGGDRSGGPAGGQAGPGGAAEAPGEIVLASGRDVTGKGGIRQQLIAAWNAEQKRKGSEVGTTAAGDQIYRLPHDGSIVDEHGS